MIETQGVALGFVRSPLWGSGQQPPVNPAARAGHNPAARKEILHCADGVCSGLPLLFDHSLILVVRANPNPDEIGAVFNGDGAIVQPHPCGP